MVQRGNPERVYVRERAGAGRRLNSEAGLTRVDADQGEPELYDQPPPRLGADMTFMVKTPSNVRDAPTVRGGVSVQGRGEFRCRSVETFSPTFGRQGRDCREDDDTRPA